MNEIGIAEDILVARQVSLVIGFDAWEDLLMGMPDSFFDLESDQKARIWRAILKMANRGESNIAQLEKIALDAILAEIGMPA